MFVDPSIPEATKFRNWCDSGYVYTI
jgi:hypothetical protein